MFRSVILKTIGWSGLAVTAATLICFAGRPLLPFEVSSGEFAMFGAVVSSLMAPLFLFPWIRRAARFENLRNRLEEMAFTDDLTGIANRRGFFAAVLERFVGGHAPKGTAVMMIDFDHFKKINDTYGHEAGDDALVQIAGQIRQTLRDACVSQALIGRMGGEEFAVVAFAIAPESVCELAERLCAEVRSREVIYAGTRLDLTISIGFVADAAGLSIDTALSHADDAAYEAKMNGRDRWCRADAPRRILADPVVAEPLRASQAA